MILEIDGRRLFYGTGSGHPADNAPTIVFVHGAGFDHAVWVMPARFFARHGYRVIALDLPAHGRSEGPPLTSIEAMADCVAGVIEAVAGARATVVGHSMGSLVTLACASRHPELVERIVLLGASSPMPVGPPLLNAAADSDHAAIDMANTWSHSHRGMLGAAGNPGMHNLNSGERWLERMAEGVYHADLAACNAFSGELTLPDVPALIITGSDDRMTPAKAGMRLAQQLSSASVVELSGSGHSMLAEQPNDVLDALAAFVIGR